MQGVCITQHVHKAVVTNDYELIAKLLRHETLDHLFSVYVRLKYLNLDLYLDYIVRLGREKVRLIETRKVLEQALPSDVATEIVDYL